MGRSRVSSVSVTALQVSRDLILDMLRDSGRGLGAIDAHIIARTIQANVTAATALPEAQVEFGALHAPPPDEVRRPVSVNRLAQSLDLPFETVRRRIKALADEGRIEIRPTGVIVPVAYFIGEEADAAVVTVNALAARAYRQLDALGFFEDRPLPTPAQQTEVHPARAVARLVTDFSLRFAHVLREVSGDYFDSLLVLQLTRLNAAALTTTGVAGAKTPDQKATASQVARALGLPFETTRRRLARLAMAGVCENVDGGYFAALEQFAPASGSLVAVNDLNLVRLYRNCALIGAVESWRGAEAAPKVFHPPAVAAPPPRA